MAKDIIYSNDIRDNDGYVVYDICYSRDKKWSVAILDVLSAPGHVHKIGVEHFIVLEGNLDISLGDEQYLLGPGKHIHIPIGTKHILKSASGEFVRLLCVNFPAFDPNDMY